MWEYRPTLVYNNLYVQGVNPEVGALEDPDESYDPKIYMGALRILEMKFDI